MRPLTVNAGLGSPCLRSAVEETLGYLPPFTNVGPEAASSLPEGLPNWMDRSTIDTVIVSDVHLGSHVSRAKDLMKILQKLSFRRLILLGDIFDHMNFQRLAAEHWDFLGYLERLSHSDVETVWIQGNHDERLEKISKLFGVVVREQYEWELGGKRYLAIHGHQFDHFLRDNPLICDIATWIYDFAQSVDTKQRRVSRFVKKLSKKWLHVSHQVAARAANYAHSVGADYVFCGHTHHALSLEINNVGYFNSGCWTDVPSHFITINEDSGVKIHAHA